MSEDLKSRIAELRADIHQRETALSDLGRELEALVGGLHGVKVGDRVRTAKGEFIVERVRAIFGDSQPWLTVRGFKKDGSPRLNTNTLYGGWEVIP